MRHVITAVLKVAAFETVMGAILFACAGRLDLPWFWALLAVHTIWMAVGAVYADPDLGKERLHPGPGGKDRFTQRIGAILLLTHLVIAGLDARYRWTPLLPTAVRAAALVVFALGMGLSIWAMVVNRFFSSVIRIQTDRGHRVIDTGPYRLVRHPGYLGMLFSSVAGGVVLGSLWSLLPLAVLVALFIRRLLIEDATLRRDLDGYAEYATRVRRKLLPGLW